MMKKWMGLLCVFAILLAAGSVQAADHKTPFDSYSQYRGYEEIKKPVYPQKLSAGEMAGNDDEIVNFLARAWYNLLAYETKTKGTKENSTLAAEIYRGIKKGPGVTVFSASDPDAVCLNALFACGTYAYWLEWNLETQTIRYYKALGVERYKKDSDYMSDYVFRNLVGASMGGLIGLGIPGEAISQGYSTSAKLYRVFDAAYKQATGKNNPIK